MGSWNSSFATDATAAAALMGLMFVGVSINLQRIIQVSKLTDRAFLILIVLITMLLVSSLLLVPGQPARLRGGETVLIGLCAWIGAIVLDTRMFKATPRQFRWSMVRAIALSQPSMFLYLIAGLILLSGQVSGLYWLVPAFMLSFVKVLWDAWILLIEINR